MKKFWADFKKFISRGNIVDMAVGVIIGSAFSAIVTSLTNKVIMPLINKLLAMSGGGLEKAYTFLDKVVDPVTNEVILEKSIYIDWGAFITAIINFFIIALVLFTILRIVMRSRKMLDEMSKRARRGRPTREQKKVLLERGVNIKDREAVVAELAKIEQEKKEKAAAEAKLNHKPTQEELLTQIRDLLVAQQTPVQTKSKKDK